MPEACHASLLTVARWNPSQVSSVAALKASIKAIVRAHPEAYATARAALKKRSVAIVEDDEEPSGDEASGEDGSEDEGSDDDDDEKAEPEKPLHVAVVVDSVAADADTLSGDEVLAAIVDA